MSLVLDGSPASEGMAQGVVFRLEWGVPVVEHRSIGEDRIDEEVERFSAAVAWAKERLAEDKKATEARLGEVEARIFDPQLLMLEDPEVVEGTHRYIRDNRLCAERAFELRMLELRSMWASTAHPMVLDRLNDLEDVMIRVLHRLMGKNDPADLVALEHDVIVVAPNLTPSLAVHLDLGHVKGVATDHGTRTAHWVMIARALQLPSVVGLGDVSTKAEEGQQAFLDGRIGRLVLDPSAEDRTVFESRRRRIEAWEEEIAVVSALESVTLDGQHVELRVNLDMPGESHPAIEHGAAGVGLFRTEFLVVGRSSMPDEDEQYESYRTVAEAFPTGAVYVRTFDLGGDKFPMFLHMPQEENPFLGWRAIRVCLDKPDLFRTQLRAILRATTHGDVRLMIPLVNDVDEIRQVRALLGEEAAALQKAGIPYNAGYKVGVMIETPAAALDAAELARYSDFFSIGTNDLVQYTLAVDRTNTRLARLYNPFHPAVVRQLHQVARVGRAAGIEVSVCGEMAANPLGALLLLGLDITALSMAWPSIPEIKKFVREIRMEHARAAARKALAAPTSRDVIDCLVEGAGDAVDQESFAARWSLPGYA